jgi:hypothetical protein
MFACLMTTTTTKTIVNHSFSKKGDRPLHYAASHHQETLLELCIEQQADVKARDCKPSKQKCDFLFSYIHHLIHSERQYSIT